MRNKLKSKSPQGLLKGNHRYGFGVLKVFGPEIKQPGCCLTLKVLLLTSATLMTWASLWGINRTSQKVFQSPPLNITVFGIIFYCLQNCLIITRRKSFGQASCWLIEGSYGKQVGLGSQELVSLAESHKWWCYFVQPDHCHCWIQRLKLR